MRVCTRRLIVVSLTRIRYRACSYVQVVCISVVVTVDLAVVCFRGTYRTLTRSFSRFPTTFRFRTCRTHEFVHLLLSRVVTVVVDVTVLLVLLYIYIRV